MTVDSPAADQQARHRRRWWVTALVWLLVLPVAVVTVLRLVGVTQVWVIATGLSFTPYLALAGLVPLALAAASRRWLAAATAALLVVRYPLTGGGYRPLPPFFGQAYAVLHVPGAPPVLVESAHPCAPSDPSRLTDWRHDLAVEPPATPRGAVRILLGDFNATLDHAPLQHLLGTGYRDAAATVGNGWDASWPYDGKPLPGIALDHVLVDPRIAVRATAVHPNPDSDHHALTALLDLPRA